MAVLGVEQGMRLVGEVIRVGESVRLVTTPTSNKCLSNRSMSNSK